MCQISRLLLWKSPQECQNVTIEFCFTMRIFYELRYTVSIEIVWTFYLESVPAKFQKYFKLISWVISGTSSSKLSCNPRHPSRNISCNHRHNLLQPSWRRIFSTSNNQKTRVDSDINIDYKASSFDKLYIWRRKWDTAGFVRAHQRKYWNTLTVGRGHANDGCSCNHRAVPPSDNETGFLWKYAEITSGVQWKYFHMNHGYIGSLKYVFQKLVLKFPWLAYWLLYNTHSSICVVWSRIYEISPFF